MVNFPFHVHRIARKDESQCGTKAAKAGTGCICESHDKTLHNHNQYTRAKDIQASNEEDRWDVFAGWPLDVDKLLSHLTVDRRSNWIINVDPCCGLMITSFDDSIIIIMIPVSSWISRCWCMPNHCATNVTTKPQSRQRHGCDDVSCLIDGEASTQTMLLLHLLLVPAHRRSARVVIGNEWTGSGH